MPINPRMIRNAILFAGNLIAIPLSEFGNEKWVFLLVFLYLLTWALLIDERSSSWERDMLIVVGVNFAALLFGWVPLVFLEWLRHDWAVLAMIFYLISFSLLALLKYVGIKHLLLLTVLFGINFVVFLLLKIPDSYFGYLFALLFASTLLFEGKKKAQN